MAPKWPAAWRPTRRERLVFTPEGGCYRDLELAVRLIPMFGIDRFVVAADQWPAWSRRVRNLGEGMVRDPRYQQIADDLRAKIERGEYAPGSRLPTEKQLSQLYNAGRNTVREAIRQIVGLRLVTTQAGAGTFVAEKIEPLLITITGGPSVGGDTAQYLSDAEARNPFNSVPRVEVQKASVAPELRLGADDSVVSRHQERFLDGIPWSLQTTFYPMRLVRQGADRLLSAANIAPGAVNYLSEVLDVQEVGWQDRVKVRVPDSHEAAFFRLPDDGRVAIIEIRRTAYEGFGTPLRLTVTACPADRNELLFQTGRMPKEQTPLEVTNGAGPVGSTNKPSSG